MEHLGIGLRNWLKSLWNKFDSTQKSLELLQKNRQKIHLKIDFSKFRID